MEKQQINWVTEISSSGVRNKEFKINGIAIHETTSRNNIKYLAEELREATPSFQDKPILKDHENKVESVIGRTTKTTFDERQKAIMFEGLVMDKDIQEKISNGLLNKVSIGAIVDNVEKGTDENGNETITAKGIEGIELSIVACPGIPGATFQNALTEAYENKGENKMEVKEKIEEVKDKTEGIVKVDEELEDDDTVVEKLGDGFALYKENYKDKKYGRLQRE
jgi:hypothetical protein